MSRILQCALIASAGCAGVSDDTGVSGESEETGPACEAWITDTWPVNGATGVYYRDAVEFTLSAPADRAVVIADVDGVQTVSEDGLTIAFIPTEPLQPETTYTFGLDFCGGTPQIQFTTSVLGGSIEAPAGLAGMTYAIDPRDGWYGGGLGAAIAGVFGRRILLQVTAVQDDILTLRAGISLTTGAQQDPCYRTVPIYGVALSGADLDYSRTLLELPFLDGLLRFFSIDVTGTLSPDLRWVGGGTLSVSVDVEGIQSLVQLENPERICDYTATFGAPCGACPGDPLQDCVQIAAVGLEGQGVAVELVEVDDTPPECE